MEENTNSNQKLDKFFKISERNSNTKAEIIGGIVNFMVICYVMVVIPGMIGGSNQALWNGIFFSTILSTIIVTTTIGFTGNVPLVYAPGLGISSYMVSLVYTTGTYSYGQCLVIILLAGIIFVTLTLTNARKKIIESMPACIKDAMGVGIGAFIAYIGLSNSGVLTFLAEGPISADGDLIWVSALVTLATFMLIVVLEKKNVKGGVFYGIVIGTVLYMILEAVVMKTNPFGVLADGTWLPPVKDFWEQCIENGLIAGIKDFGSAFNSASNIFSTIVGAVLMVFTFTLIDIFDTVGTILGTCKRGNLLQEDGYPPRFNQIMIVDSSAAILSAVTGVPTCNAYVESAAGIESGARTGFASVITSLLFLLCLFISPIARLIPGEATYAALIYVGVLMFTNVNDLDFTNVENSVPSFLTIVMMPFTSNIAFGIAAGLFSYIVIKIFTGKAKEVSVFAYICTALFIIFFATQNLFTRL